MQTLDENTVPFFKRRAVVAGGGVVALIVVGLIVRGFIPAGKQAPPAPPRVTAEKIARQDLPVYRFGLGTVRALNSVVLKSRVDGTLEKVLFTEGDEVKAGDVLAQLDPRPFQAALNAALAKKAQDEAQLSKARSDLARTQALAQSQFSSRQALETQQTIVAQLQATLKADDAQVDSARLQLQYSTLTAPISGRIGLRQVDPGNMVRSTDAQGLAIISQIHPITVTFSLPANELPILNKSLARGKPSVSAYSSNDRERLADGELVTIDSAVDTASGTIKAKAVFSNADNALWPGQSVSAHVRVDTVKDALTIPTRAIQRSQNGLFVYVVQQDNTVAARTIDVGESYEDTSAVMGKIAEGELVVTDGQSRLVPGTRVVIATAVGEGEVAQVSTNKSAK